MSLSSGTSNDAPASPNPDYGLGTVPTKDKDGDVGMTDASDDGKPVMPWHEHQKMLRIIGLQTLNEEGYINLDTIDYDVNFGWADPHRQRAAWFRKELDEKAIAGWRPVNVDPLPALPDRIHPLFRKNRWLSHETIDQNYNMLLPTFQLATLLLEEESMTAFLIGMSDIASHRKIYNHKAARRIGSELYWFQAKTNASDAEKHEMWKKLRSLTQHVTFAVGDDKFGLHGLTVITKDSPGLAKDGGDSTITIHKDYLLALTNRLSVSSQAINWTPGTDPASARLRVSLLLAITLVHEVTHAFWMAIKGVTRVEPFYRDTRIAELGNQWEKLIVGGCPEALSSSRTCPYGLGNWSWPALDEPIEPDEKLRDPTLMSAKKWGREPHWESCYAIEMSWVQGFFTNDFWDEVDRYGIYDLKPVKRLGVRMHEKPKYWAGESPTAPRFLSPPKSPQSVEGEDDANGVVRKMI